MSSPVVAIVGRPNVGKSSLFNWLVGRRVSIVDPTAGVTRDRVSTQISVNDRHFELTDTGGIGIEDIDNLTADVERQIQNALDQADVILFVVDARSGFVSLDQIVAERLRKIDKPIIVVANKCDAVELDMQSTDFHCFGYDPVIPVSAEQKRGMERLLHAILAVLPESSRTAKPKDVALEIAIVGRRNVGKSTFINCLAEAERVIVSEVPGTTRDSIDVRFERDGKTFIAIDTAGVRNRSSIASDIEFYSLTRAERSIRRAGVVLHFFDARLRISKVDKQLTQYILEANRPAIFVINKWDLAKDSIATEQMATYVRRTFPMLDYVPIAFITAKSGKNVYRLLNLAQQLAKQTQVRVGTGDLNRVLRMALEANPPSHRQSRLPKIFYATQVGIEPPTIVLFTNNPELFDNTYKRYLLKFFRDHFPFGEVPVKLEFRTRHGGGLSSDEQPEESLHDTVLLDGPDTENEAPSEKPAQAPKPAPAEKPRHTYRKKERGVWDV